MSKTEERYIPLFWWSETQLMGKEKENYGDLISKYLVEKISSKPVKWIQPLKTPWYKRKKINYLAAGSIIHHCNSRSVIWGSGIIDIKQNITDANFLAVRGPETRKFLLSLGHQCPEIYGDPALLLPDLFDPAIEKKYDYGIIPHYNDYSKIKKLYGSLTNTRIIDMMTLDVEKTTREILSCKKVVSSSLHGVIVAHAYGIPAVCAKFSDKVFGDGIKYTDYYSSLELFDFKQVDFTQNNMDFESLFENNLQPSAEKINSLKEGLYKTCPF